MRFSVPLIALAASLTANASPIKVTRDVSATTVTVLSTYNVFSNTHCPSTDSVPIVVEFAEILEQLETQFYTQALAKFQPSDFTAAGISVPDVAIQNFQDILAHETAHVAM